MAKKMQTLLDDGYFEKDFYQGKMVATVQLRQTVEGFSATWWVSGPGELWMLRLLLELQMQITTQDLATAIKRCELLVDQHIFQLATYSSLSGGLRSLAPENSPELRNALAVKHLEAHKKLENFLPSLGDAFSTIQLYMVAKGFGVKSPVNFVANYLSLPTSTINRRLARARDKGQVAKERQGVPVPDSEPEMDF